MKIADVIYSVGRSGFFNIDLMAVKAGARLNGFVYEGQTVSPGFRMIAQPGTSLSIMLRLDDGQVAFGDCVDVIFTGVAGRDPLFIAEEHVAVVRGALSDRLRGRSIDTFRPLAAEIDRLQDGGKRLHTALRYGATQALLHAVALARHRTMAEVIAAEYACEIAKAPIPILASCSTHDRLMIDRMILKQADLLPHGEFTVVERDIGREGEKLLAYAGTIVRRVREIGAPGYRPTIHLDLYGTLGELFERDTDRIVAYIGKLGEVVAPHDLLIESPVIMETRRHQIEIYAAMRKAGARIRDKPRTRAPRIIVDEWCNTLEDVQAFADAEAGDCVQIKIPDLGGINNTIEAILYARSKGMGACLGGTGNETDQSSRITTHIGLACQPSFLLSKPGFGGDEALMIETNEMRRTLALIGAPAA